MFPSPYDNITYAPRPFSKSHQVCQVISLITIDPSKQNNNIGRYCFMEKISDSAVIFINFRVDEQKLTLKSIHYFLEVTQPDTRQKAVRCLVTFIVIRACCRRTVQMSGPTGSLGGHREGRADVSPRRALPSAGPLRRARRGAGRRRMPPDHWRPHLHILELLHR